MPKRTDHIAAQIEALSTNGAALACGSDALGFRGIPLLPDAGLFDGKLPIVTLEELGPYDPQQRIHHAAFAVPITREAVNRFLHVETYGENAPFVNDFAPGEAATVHLSWQKTDQGLVARYTSNEELDFMILFNGCLSPAEVQQLDLSGAVLRQGEFEAALKISGAVSGFCQADTANDAEVLLRGYVLPREGAKLTAHRVRLAPDAPVYMSLSCGVEVSLEPEKIDQDLEAGIAAYEAECMLSSGSAADCADAIQRLVGYSACYDPQERHWFAPVNRDWTGPNRLPPVFMWDNFFDSYLSVWSQPELGKQSLGHILNIIKTRGLNHAPPQKNLVVPIVYSKLVRTLNDEDFARDTFPAMMTFMRFWFSDRGDGHPQRDGNDDGLIECGSHTRPGEVPLARVLQDAFDETGYDDSPMYSAGFAYQRQGIPAENITYDHHRGTLNLTMIGQNSLYVAASRSMAVVAEWIGADEDREWLLSEAERVEVRIQERLFDASKGYYMNRFFDGSFSSVKTMTIFYPLMTDLCNDETRERLREALLDPNQFWGDNVIPTVSRDDPAYACDPWRDPYWLGQYWRGNIWAPTNYITYLSLLNTDWTDVTDEFASKSRRLFMDDWLPRHHAMENYPPVGNTPETKIIHANGGRGPHYIWAGLLPMIALEQLFSVEETSGGIRFGTMNPDAFGSWERFFFSGCQCSVHCAAEGLTLEIPDLLTFTSSHPLQIRRFDLKTGAFEYRSQEDAEVRITLAGAEVVHSLEASPNQLTTV